MFRGRYINLDRNSARRTALEENLRQAGVADRYARFAGVDGIEAKRSRQTSLRPGYLGNWLSHERLAHEHRDQGEHLHLLEDDAVLPAADAGPLFEEVLRRADAEIEGWDLLFTETAPSIETRAYVALAEHVLAYARTRHIAFVPLASLDFAGMSSYFVNRRSLTTYSDLIADGWRHGVPIDLFLREKVHRGELRAYVTAPFLTTVSDLSAESDVLGQHDFAHAVLDLYRQCFYIRANLPALSAKLATLARDSRIHPLHSIFITAHAAALSEDWKNF